MRILYDFCCSGVETGYLPYHQEICFVLLLVWFACCFFLFVSFDIYMNEASML